MAFDKEFLLGIGVEEHHADVILDMHRETVEFWESEVSRYKEAADEVARLEAELKEISKSDDLWRAKYEAVRDEYEAALRDCEAKELRRRKSVAYESLLRECGVMKTAVSLIMRSNPTAIDEVLLDQGTVVNKIAVKDRIKSDWADFINRPFVAFFK